MNWFLGILFLVLSVLNFRSYLTFKNIETNSMRLKHEYEDAGDCQLANINGKRQAFCHGCSSVAFIFGIIFAFVSILCFIAAFTEQPSCP